MPDRTVTQIFGKLPRHGDFIARGVSPERREALDAWLSGSLAAARSCFGADFETRYDSAPPWRFALPEGDAWLGGALTPSVDAAGRRFPLMVARTASNDAAAAGAALLCEDMIYAAFDGGWDVDRLHAAVADATAADAEARDGWWTDGNDSFSPAANIAPQPEDLLTLMLTHDGAAA